MGTENRPPDGFDGGPDRDLSEQATGQYPAVNGETPNGHGAAAAALREGMPLLALVALWILGAAMLSWLLSNACGGAPKGPNVSINGGPSATKPKPKPTRKRVAAINLNAPGPARSRSLQVGVTPRATGRAPAVVSTTTSSPTARAASVVGTSGGSAPRVTVRLSPPKPTSAPTVAAPEPTVSAEPTAPAPSADPSIPPPPEVTRVPSSAALAPGDGLRGP